MLALQVERNLGPLQVVDEAYISIRIMSYLCFLMQIHSKLYRGKREILCGSCNGAGFLGGFMSTSDSTAE